MAKGTALVAAAALALAGCGDAPKKYDGRTEHALSGVIHPGMVRQAGSLIGFLVRHSNLVAMQSSSEPPARFETEFTGSTKDALGNKENLDLEVASTGQTSQGLADPNKVVAIYVGESDADGSKSYYSLYSPGSTNDVGLGNAHTQGWSAQESGMSSPTIFPDATPYLLDSSNPENFTTDTNSNPTNPVATAEVIVADLQLAIKSIELNFAR